MNLPLLSLMYASVLLGVCMFMRVCVCVFACMHADRQAVSVILVSELSCDC